MSRRYHHRPRFTIQGEHFSELKFTVTGAQNASGHIFDIDNDSKKTHKFKLTKKNAVALQKAFGSGWTALDAVVFVYAALGVEWSGANFSIESPASDPAMDYNDGFIWTGTCKACGVKL